MQCQFPLCKQHEYKNGLCINHHRIYGSNPPVRNITTIPKKSKTQKELDDEYHALIYEMRKESDKCDIKIKCVCTGTMEGGHHIQKRTRKNMCDRSNILRSCNACNSWIETHPLEAINLGLSISKHKKQN
ncbi:hypothetical protein ACLOAU_14450 [Niabella sp. CJ426]|uniref:hypothetical protein n=1 Tax=Niabella sp. CJ426 TaxID=3393740 RepID=UPI003D084309